MDSRLRDATTAEISMALGKLFRALPPRKASPAELEESYLIACHRATKHAIETVVIKLIRGELDGLSKSFAPSPAELSSAIREEMAAVRRQIARDEAHRVQIADNRQRVAPRVSPEESIRVVRAKMLAQGRAVLFSQVSHSRLLQLRDLPAGACYSALTGEVYGPPAALGDIA